MNLNEFEGFREPRIIQNINPNLKGRFLLSMTLNVKSIIKEHMTFSSIHVTQSCVS